MDVNRLKIVVHEEQSEKWSGPETQRTWYVIDEKESTVIRGPFTNLEKAQKSKLDAVVACYESELEKWKNNWRRQLGAMAALGDLLFTTHKVGSNDPQVQEVLKELKSQSIVDLPQDELEELEKGVRVLLEEISHA